MRNKPILTAVGLIGIGITMGVMLVTSLSGPGAITAAFAGESIGAGQKPLRSDAAVSALNKAFVDVSKAVSPSVVYIAVSIKNSPRGSEGQSTPETEEMERFFRFFGVPQDQAPQRKEGSGSGVFITAGGYIITNNHVVEGASDGDIVVTTNDRREHKARLIGTDPLTDLAVIKIDGDGYSPAYFANSDEVEVGEWVIAVGNPLGLRSTITAGIISAKGRGQLGLNNSSSYAVENFLQTDAAINPGNSGGGLFDLEGQLVGINTAIATRTGYYQGYGFAIPANLVRSVAMDLLDDGKVNRGYIGVQISTVDEAQAKALGLSEVSGVMVNDVVKGGAGEAAGIEPGDVILELDGDPVRTSNELQSRVAQRRAGQQVKLTLWRNGKRVVKTATLRSNEQDDSVAEARNPRGGEPEKAEPKELPMKDLGITLAPLDEKQRKDADIKGGIVITSVDPASDVARTRKLFKGDIIISIDRKPVGSLREAEQILSAKRAGEAALLQVKSKGGTRMVGIEIPSKNG